MGVLASGLGRRSSSHYSPTGSPNSPSLLANRQFAFPMLAALAVAALGLSLLFLYNSTFAQTGVQQPVMYAEDRTDPVLTLRAEDPEGVSPIVWSIFGINDEGEVDNVAVGLIQDIDGDGDDDVVEADVADGEFFKVNGDGELTFVSLDFENPRGVLLADDNTNTYKVVVQASDGGVTDKLNWFKVTVNVTDVEEEGKLAEWTVDADGDGDIQTPSKLLQFKPGAILAVGDPTDGDGGVTNIRWQWYRSSSPTAPGDPIDDATSATYAVQDTSADNDVGMYLRVVATYDDRRGFNKTAEYVSENPVQAARNNLNTAPMFPLYNVTRGIEEESKGDIGSPVTGTDADVSDQSAVADILTYSLLTDTEDSADNDNGTFSIDRATGQLKLPSGLDFEAATDVGLSGDAEVNPQENTYVVRLKATDSSGDDSDPVTVVITVTDVNEDPTFGDASPEGMLPDQAEGMTAIDSDTDTEGVQDLAPFTATDPEEGNVTLSLMGDDAAMFTLAADTESGNEVSRVLSFKAKPDFEMPGDSNSDNIYEVTVVASDGANTATRSVTVKVTDADEAGKVTLSSQDALIGVELTAELADSDGGVPDEDRFMRQEWQWYSLVSETVAVFDGDGDLNMNVVSGTDVREVLKVGDDEATYTPDADDRDRHLRAMVTYTDRTRDTDNVDTNNDANAMFVGFTNTAMSDATTPVRNNPDNQAPKFTDGTSTFRLVEENTKALSDAADDDDAAEDNPADNVGGLPVAATDDDDDTLAYTLGGRDKDMFRVRANGQLEVSDKANLDFETKTSHTVTVIADDNFGESNSISTITVTIYVTDLDEPPTIADAGDSTVKDNRQSVVYAEDRTDPVLTLSGEDPEGVTPIVWSIFVDDGEIQDIDGDGDDDVLPADAADAARFKVNDDGELTFGTSPSFESPVSTETSNTYKVVVQASDGGVTDKLNWFKVTVNVTDVEEDGELAEWTVGVDVDNNVNTPVETFNELLQFKPGAVLTVVDPDDDDGDVTNVRWQWYRSSSPTADGDPIDGATLVTYTVQDTTGANDVGKYLRVVATYDADNVEDNTAEYVSENPVQAARRDVNTAPTFPLDDVARRIAENTKGDFGSPVTGTDADVRDQSAVADILTYSLLPDGGDNDNATFKIDRATGQLKLPSGLDFETPSDVGLSDDDDNDDMDNTYVVTLKATDSSGAGSETVTVVITVTDLNEKPEFGIDGVNNGFGGIAGMAPDHREDSLDADDVVDLTISTYTATDPEGGDVTLSLTGDDEAMFELATDSITGPNASRVLSFKAKPDFEMKGDSNSDNIYEVTVVASDGVNTATRSVTVKVTDADEGGEVTLSSQDALIGIELTATLADSDGGVPDEDRFMRQAWEWQKATPADNVTCDVTNTEANAAAWEKAGSGSMYTPKAGDRGDCLRAMVTYTDRTRDTNNDPDDNTADQSFVGFTNMVTSDATTKVRNNPDNQAPKFDDGTSTFRLVEENTKALSDAADDDDAAEDNPADNVGGLPVTAKDDNDGDTVAYTLGGLDKDMFRVRANGQLEVSDKAMLDHEAKSSHTITVTATDSSNTANDSATITVTIYVTDLDERPTIMASAGGVTITGLRSVRLEEETTTATGATYAAEGATLTLSGTDAGDFRLMSNGALTFRSTPDYEDPMDANGDNTYMVTVMATDGEMTDSRDVTVTVINVEEPGEVTLSTTRPQVGTAINASVTDDDNVVGSVRWQWARSESMGGPYSNIPGATTDVYTPVEADAEMYLQATAFYTDGHGSGKSESAETANMVPAADAVDTVFDRYDDDDSGRIDKSELAAAVFDYEIERTLDKADLAELVFSYEIGG